MKVSSRDIEAVGHHFVVGLQRGTVLTEHDRRLLGELKPAGIALFKSNFDHNAGYDVWLAEHAKQLDEVRNIIGRDRLLVAIDHEGARVCRTPAPLTRFAFPARWARTSAAVGDAMGMELASIGVNLNFAPLLDINTNPQNPVVGERAFATTAADVSAAALPFMAAMQAHGVLACGKHFPGHGDTFDDSHRAMPVVDRTLDELRQRELLPFADAIGAGIPLIMTSHILMTAIDSTAPATFSKRIINDLLREELQFKGVVISDDLGMRAMDGVFDDSAAVQCVRAGNDLLLIASYWSDTGRVRGFARALLEAQSSGEISQGVLDRSAERIAALLERAPQHAVRPLSAAVFARNRQAGTNFAAETAEVI